MKNNNISNEEYRRLMSSIRKLSGRVNELEEQNKELTEQLIQLTKNWNLFCESYNENANTTPRRKWTKVYRI